MKIQLAPEIERALVELLESQRELNAHRARWMDAEAVYWEKASQRSIPEAPMPMSESTETPDIEMADLGDLFHPLDPDDLPEDTDDDPVPV
ncbi:MAG: hypothetical protein M0Z36_03365 [Thermaerobacter sp.]|nr:hypothetical protein [Thermaerobacter sp.]